MQNREPEAPRIAKAFIAAINDRDVLRIGQLMTEDHRFVDATGTIHAGRETMRSGWVEYFSSFPAYRIEIETTVASGGVVALFGWASGTARVDPGSGRARSWRIPAAWKAVVHGGRIAESHVCCDVEPMLRSLGVERW